MNMLTYTREQLRDGVRLSAADCQFTFNRIEPGVLLIVVSGHDSGQFGTGVLDELTQALQRETPLTLFIDARATGSVIPRVREDWTRFLASNRANFAGVHVLTGSKIVQLTIQVAQLFSNTGHLIRLYSSPDAFHAALHRVQRRGGTGREH